jgi:purine-nucleoside phosphorylase
MREEITIGDYVLAEGALRGDGVTRYYVDDAFVPSADKGITDMLQEGFEKVQRGVVWTTDAILKETKAFVNDAISKGAIAVDMVTSPFLTIAQIYNKKAAALLVVSDNVITGEVGFANIKVFDAEKRMIDRTFDLIGAIDQT